MELFSPPRLGRERKETPSVLPTRSIEETPQDADGLASMQGFHSTAASQSDSDRPTKAPADASRRTTHVGLQPRGHQRAAPPGELLWTEHPEQAASWSLPQTQCLLNRDDIAVIGFDQCMLGLSVVPEGRLSRKGTKIATNNAWLAYELCMSQCQEQHEHVPLFGGLPQKAQHYPRALCQAIAKSTKAVCLGAPWPSFVIVSEEADENVETTLVLYGDDDSEEERPTVGGPVEETLSPSVTQLSAAQRRLVSKVHINSGRPDRQRMLRAFKSAGALPQVLHYIRHEFSCEDCDLKQGPDVRRRAQFPKTFAFNKILCVDFLFIQFKEQRVPILNMICAGTSYQIAVRAPMSTAHGGTPTSTTAWKLFVESWQRYFGLPQLIICDSGNEFKGAFERGRELCGVLQHVILPECPWQNGKAEGHGGWLKNRLDAELHGGRCTLQTLEEIDEFLATLTSVKNRWLCRGGYTAAQLVFGELPRIPGELLAEDELAIHGMHDAYTTPWPLTRQQENIDDGARSVSEPGSWRRNNLALKPSGSQCMRQLTSSDTGPLDNGSMCSGGPSRIKTYIFEVDGWAQASWSSPTTEQSTLKTR